MNSKAEPVLRSSGLFVDSLEDIEAAYTNRQDIDQASFQVFEEREVSRNLAIPTEDARVRKLLQDEGEPQTLFGEGPNDRRNRLREILTKKIVHKKESVENKTLASRYDDESDESEQSEEFYSYGCRELPEARKDICFYSLKNASKRLEYQAKEVNIQYTQRKKVLHEFYGRLKKFETKGIQLGDTRPLSYCTFSPNSKYLLTGSWGGTIKLWNTPECSELETIEAHTERVCCMDFHPESTISQSASELNFASSSSNGTVKLWSLNSKVPIATINAHALRVPRVKFHPSGRYMGTTSWDCTWKLWDVETRHELLLQTGHSREVFDIGFQCDGSLVATCGLDGVGIVWDLRIGKAIIMLQGHVRPVHCLDWSPGGYQIATGSEDNTIKIWDVRMANILYTVPAHKNVVSKVRYWHGDAGFVSKIKNWANNIISKQDDKQDANISLNSEDTSEVWKQVLSGSFLVSSSYDGSCCIWSNGDYKALKILRNLENKIMCCDLSRDARFIATASYDRTFKLYELDDF